MARTKKRQKQLDKMKRRKVAAVGAASKVLVKMPTSQYGFPEVVVDNWLRAVADNDGKVFDAIIQYLIFFETHHFKQFGIDAIRAINKFVEMTYITMTSSDLVPTPQQSSALVQVAHLFAHLVAVSSYETNDGAMKSAFLLEKNLSKVLFLQNNRCAAQLEQAEFFNLDPILASQWFQSYMLGISCPTKLIQSNVYRHLESMDERWIPTNHHVTGIYFTSTYLNPGAARRCKGILNSAIQKSMADHGHFKFANRPSDDPDKKHIAIVTNKWHRNHAVYKSASPLVEQLRGHYKLSLIWTGENLPDTIVRDYFDSFYQCYFKHDGGFVIAKEVQNNDFDMVYFPDVGMTDESVWLSNARMAPIQAMGYGHPETSGDSSQIDYFIGGDVEKESTDQYSETMVLLPGLAQEPAWPTAERKHNYLDDGKVRINCVWGPDKYNHTLLTVLAAINDTVGSIDHEFHLFGSPGMNRYAALPAFERDVRNLLPNAITHTEQEYYDYMENAEMHDFSLNSFPFGCYNVLIESLYMGLPFLTLIGDRFYNRAGMWLNEQIGMECNNFQSPRDLINKAAQLILEPEMLAEQRAHLAATDLKAKLFTLKGQHFLEAVQYIFDNHPFNETKIIGSNE